MATPANDLGRRTSAVEAGTWTPQSARSDGYYTDRCPLVGQAARDEAGAYFAALAAEGRLTDGEFEQWLMLCKAAVVAAATEAWNSTPGVVPAGAPRQR